MCKILKSIKKKVEVFQKLFHTKLTIDIASI